MSALPPKADIGEGIAECLLLTQSGHCLVLGLRYDCFAFNRVRLPNREICDQQSENEGRALKVELRDRGAKIRALKLAVFILLPLIVSSCTRVPHYEEIHLYDGPNLPTENLAALQENHWDRGFIMYVQRSNPWERLYHFENWSYKGESPIIWEKMFLLPGKYQIGLYVAYNDEYARFAGPDCKSAHHATVDLQAGHLYVKKTRGWIPFWGKQCYYGWLEDAATGKKVLGGDGR